MKRFLRDATLVFIGSTSLWVSLFSAASWLNRQRPRSVVVIVACIVWWGSLPATWAAYGWACFRGHKESNWVSLVKGFFCLLLWALAGYCWLALGVLASHR
jgi:hypothetical protein